MTTPATTVAVGIFDNRENAERAVANLRRAGFAAEQLGLATRDGVSHVDEENLVSRGVAVGATTGAGLGALSAIGITSIGLPAVGPALAGGLLASILASAAGGAAVGGLVGALVGMGVPEKAAQFYEGQFLAGRTIVTVHAGERYQDAVAILAQHGGYDAESEAAAAVNSGAALP